MMSIIILFTHWVLHTEINTKWLTCSINLLYLALLFVVLSSVHDEKHELRDNEYLFALLKI